MTGYEVAELSALRHAAIEHAARARLEPLQATDDPLPIQMVFSAIYDGHTVHLANAIDATKFLEGDEADFWRSTIDAAKHALVLWQSVEVIHGHGCLADVDKWLRHCPPEVVGIQTIGNSRQLIAQMGKDFRDRVVSFTAWAFPEHQAGTATSSG